MKQPANHYRYSLTDLNGTAYVVPFGEASYRIEWTREDEQKNGYNKTMPGKVVFTGATFTELLNIEKTNLRCNWIYLIIQKNCGGTWADFYSGRFSLNDAAWDLSRCKVEIKLDKSAPDQCIQDNKTTEINLFDKIPSRFGVSLYKSQITIETVEYKTSSPGNCTAAEYWGGSGTAAAGGWAAYLNSYTEIQFTLQPLTCYKTTRWARQKLTQPSANPSPGAEWVLISDVSGVKTWAKPAAFYDCTETPTLPEGSIKGGFTKECKILGVDSGSYSSIDNGLKLKAVLEALVNEFCTGLTVKSQFFQINPDTITATNYVTGQPSKVSNILVFQKSDVKRPSVSGNATKANMTFEKLMAALGAMFNVQWDLIGTTVRVEHVSWFSKTAGLDLTLPRYAKNVNGLSSYSYKSEQIPQSEEFKFMEASAGDFAGVPITYEGACVSAEGKKNKKTIAAENVTTDLELVLNNPDSDSNTVTDDGFVFIACDANNLVLTEPAILQTGIRLNNTLAWAQLQRDYHKHNRPLQTGYMNNVLTNFISVIPTRKGAALTVPFCCGDTFNPSDTVKTALGDGTVEKAAFNFKNDTLTLDLIYPAFMTPYVPPVAINDVFNATAGQTIIYDVIANDTPSNGGGPITEIQIVEYPINGTAIVVAGPKIQYTPPPTGSGSDALVYRVRDGGGVWSNNALVSITILV
jgi:hypothetical protein